MLQSEKNLYEILDVSEDASQDEIKQAYRKLAREHHPDLHNGSVEKQRMFVEINQAYEILSDPQKRDQYNHSDKKYGGFEQDKNFEEVLLRYKEQFYRDNCCIFLEQLDDSTKILYAGFDPPVVIKPKRTHTSKSRTLPIVTAEKEGSNVVVTSLGHNFHNYFVGIELQKEIPATLMWPVSGLFSRYALSGHTDPEGAPPITNFEKAYHNRTPIKRFGIECTRPLHAALLIRYLNEVSKLPIKSIFDIVLDKTSYGKIDAIDFNAVGGDGEAKLARILNLGFKKFAYYNFDVTNAPDIFKRINVDWFDLNNDNSSDNSSVHFEFVNQRLPPLTVPYNSLLIPTTKEQQALGIGKEVPAMNMQIRDDHEKERHQLIFGDKLIADQYHRAEWGNMNWTINTPNGLDTALAAYLLTHVLVPTMSYFAPDKIMLPENTLLALGSVLEKQPA